jgi:hypothetical protein
VSGSTAKGRLYPVLSDGAQGEVLSKPEDYLALAVQLALDNVGIRRVYYVYSNEDGEPVGLSTSSLYAELSKPLSMQAMRAWTPAYTPGWAGSVWSLEAAQP